MSIAEIVSELRAERTRIEKAISALDGIASEGSGITTQHNRASSRTRRRGHMSPEGRRRISEIMKKRWAERRKMLRSDRQRRLRVKSNLPLWVLHLLANTRSRIRCFRATCVSDIPEHRSRTICCRSILRGTRPVCRTSNLALRILALTLSTIRFFFLNGSADDDHRSAQRTPGSETSTVSAAGSFARLRWLSWI